MLVDFNLVTAGEGLRLEALGGMDDLTWFADVWTDTDYKLLWRWQVLSRPRGQVVAQVVAEGRVADHRDGMRLCCAVLQVLTGLACDWQAPGVRE